MSDNLKDNQSPTFELGDKVKAFGVEGVVEDILKNTKYQIAVRFAGGEYCSFTAEGVECDWHKTPSLILVEKWKPMREELKLFVANTVHRLDLVEQFDGKFGGKNVKITIEEIR